MFDERLVEYNHHFEDCAGCNGVGYSGGAFMTLPSRIRCEVCKGAGVFTVALFTMGKEGALTSAHLHSHPVFLKGEGPVERSGRVR